MALHGFAYFRMVFAEFCGIFAFFADFLRPSGWFLQVFAGCFARLRGVPSRASAAPTAPDAPGYATRCVRCYQVLWTHQRWRLQNSAKFHKNHTWAIRPLDICKKPVPPARSGEDFSHIPEPLRLIIWVQVFWSAPMDILLLTLM